MTKRGQRRGQSMSEVIIIVALIGIAAIGIITIFGDHLRALFGMSADATAGETSVERARPGNQAMEKKNLQSFGENNAYDGDNPPGG